LIGGGETALLREKGEVRPGRGEFRGRLYSVSTKTASLSGEHTIKRRKWKNQIES